MLQHVRMYVYACVRRVWACVCFRLLLLLLHSLTCSPGMGASAPPPFLVPPVPAACLASVTSLSSPCRSWRVCVFFGCV